MALRSIGDDLSPSDLAVLGAFRNRPRTAATATELADGLGYASYSAANLAVGPAGKKFADAVPDFDLRCRASDGTPMWWSVLADGKTSAGPTFVWTLHPPPLVALHEAGVG